MPREPHYGDTGAEAQRVFDDFFASVGWHSDTEFQKQVLGVVVDGLPLAERPIEFAFPGSNFYAKEYLEALAVARLLVQVDMDDGAQIIRRDAPDIEVRLRDGKVFYIEHRMMGEQHVISMPRYVELVNKKILDTRAQDPALEAAFTFNGWTFLCRFAFIPEDERSTVDSLAGEVIRLIRELSGTKRVLIVDDEAYPLLSRYRATVACRPTTAKTVTMLLAGEASWVGPRAEIGPLLRHALEEKRRKAEKYEPACRPLWLLLSVADDRNFGPILRQQVIQELIEAELRPYDKVVVTFPGMEPVNLTRTADSYC